MVPMWRPSSSALLLVALLASCAPPSPQAQIEDAERAAMTSLKTQNPDIIMGFDFHGSGVDVSIDVNQFVTLDPDDEAALEADALKRWRTVWIASHPRQHAKLTLRFLDFRGRVQYRGSAKA